MTASRSGSTLLRFLLDSHPDLACPPETSIASACAGLARTWDILESAGSGTGRPVHESMPLPPHAALAVREAIDRVYGHYLARRGKRRWCDKSLDSFQFAELITQVYPGAKFLCLFRHPMDVIASGVEACPWGLHRFGFDPFAAQYPGNSVAAIGSYWLAVSQALLDFQDNHPDVCHRVRYEDLVAAPEVTAAAIFSFLGAAPAPGIARACFRTPHEGEGPGDEKIWFTTEVTGQSVGRGLIVPAAALPPPLRDSINSKLGVLGYRLVDDQWNAAPGRVDPRTNLQGPHPSASDSAAELGDLVAATETIKIRVACSGEAGLHEMSNRWPAVAGSTVELIVQSPSGQHKGVQLTFPTAAQATSLPPGAADGQADASVPAGPAGTSQEPIATIIGGAATWQSLLSGRANFVTEITTGQLRCVNKRDGHRIRSDEIHAVATLLGMATIPMAQTPAVPETEASMTTM